VKRAAHILWNELLPLSPIFTTVAVAQRAGITLANASRDLAEMEKGGTVVRVRRGLWAVQQHPDFSPYAVVPALFEGQSGGYVSLLSALNLHGMIEQIPRVVHVVTQKQRPRLRTPVATYEFHRLAPRLFGGYVPYRRTGKFDIATPAKALFDTIYLSVRKGRRFAALPELDLAVNFSPSEVEHWIERIELVPLRVATRERWAEVARRSGAGG
jgi:predicted transcriptional regulator of viral defense system